ncbi:UPF0613 protein PB24D3.06c 1 [Naviculisporaceae sp. PSN 640]
MSTTPFTVTVHPFKGNGGHQLIAYEHLPYSNATSPPTEEQGTRGCLVFIGGLTAGPHTTNIDFLVNNTGLVSLGYYVWELHMRSSYSGFGYSSLKNDAEDIASLVGYLRGRSKSKGKIVLVGASTGCQGLLSYAALGGQEGVDGYILLNPVSDREFASFALPADLLESSVVAAKSMIDQGDGDEIISPKSLPPVFDTPVSAYRWWSLAAKGGDDDFFSSDLSDAEINRKFGPLKGKPVIFLPGEKDEMVPLTVDREALLERWITAVTATALSALASPEDSATSVSGLVKELSGFIPEADHVLSGRCARDWVGARIAEFVGRLEG